MDRELFLDVGGLVSNPMISRLEYCISTSGSGCITSQEKKWIESSFFGVGVVSNRAAARPDLLFGTVHPESIPEAEHTIVKTLRMIISKRCVQ
jgi:hypothetical protein